MPTVLKRKTSRQDPKSSSASGRQEVTALIPLLKKKLTEDRSVDNEYADAFLRDSLVPHLQLYVRKAPWYKNRYRWMASLIITFGLVSSALGAVAKGSKGLSTAGSWGVIILGVLIGILSHWLQIWRPSERSVAYYHARTALRHEIWDFLTDGGVYAQLDANKRFPTFVRQVLKYETQATVIDEQTDVAATPASAPSGGDTSG